MDTDSTIASQNNISKEDCDINKAEPEGAAPESKTVFASDFDRIVSEGSIEQAPNPAPLEDEKK